MAIKFIYDNAEKIGGDRNRITIGGESAGSISSSFQMLTPETSSMVSQVILQSGKPNASCGKWCPDVGPQVKACCEHIGQTKGQCTTVGKTTEEVVDQLRLADGPAVYSCFDYAGVGVGVNTEDRTFFKTDPYQIVRDRSFKSDVNVLIGFTSFEGSLVMDDYPTRFYEGNFMQAYKEWPNDLYNDLNLLNSAELGALARRKFHQLACANNFQPFFDQINTREAVAMALAVYGDIGFRVSGVAHARYYLEAGANVFVFNFDTHENHGGQLVGAAHADELKYLFAWGLSEPWQHSVGDFLVKSWRSFIKTGDPSYSDHKWEPFDGKELHMEIENDENGVVVRNDQYFDFDVFHRLDMSSLEQEKPTVAECSVVVDPVSTTKPPASYCMKVTVSGSETGYYPIAGDYHADGELNDRRVWAKPGDWYIAYDGTQYCITYGRGKFDQCVVKSSFTLTHCAADVDLKWNVWNTVDMLDVGTCSDRFCVTAPDLTTTSKVTSTKTSTTTATGTTGTPSRCSEVKLVGTIAKDLGYECLYVETAATFNNYPVFECADDPAKLLFLRNDEHLAFFTQTTNDAGPLIWLERTSNSFCPSDNDQPFGFWNEKLDGPIKIDEAERFEISWESNAPPTTPQTECDQVSLVGTIASAYSLDCYYVETQRTFNDYPVYECDRNGDTKYLFKRKDNYLAFHTEVTDENGPLLWIENTSGSLCPLDNISQFGFWNFDTNSVDTTDPSGASWGAIEGVSQSHCTRFSVIGSAAESLGLDCYFIKLDQVYNNYPVFECKRQGLKILFFLRQNNYFVIHNEIMEGDGPLIWIQRTSPSLCPTDNDSAFGFWDGYLATADSTQVSFGAKPSTIEGSPDCTGFTLHGSIATSYDLAGDYHRVNADFNGYSVFECNSYDEPKVFYLRSDGYLGFHEFSTRNTDGPTVWIQKTADSDCPTDNQEAFGFWNFDLATAEKHDIADRSEIDWTKIDPTIVSTEQPPTTTTIETTEPTTTVKVRFERVKPSNIFRVIWHKLHSAFIFP